MNQKVNNQRHIHTGDVVTVKDKKVKVHYVVENDGQMSFESPLNLIKEIVGALGDTVVYFKPNELVF